MKNGQIVVNILDLKGHIISVTTNQCWHCRTKAAIDNNTWTNECGYIPVKFYLWTFEFCIIFTYNEQYSSFDFVQPLKSVWDMKDRGMKSGSRIV